MNRLLVPALFALLFPLAGCARDDHGHAHPYPRADRRDESHHDLQLRDDHTFVRHEITEDGIEHTVHGKWAMQGGPDGATLVLKKQDPGSSSIVKSALREERVRLSPDEGKYDPTSGGGTSGP